MTGRTTGRPHDTNRVIVHADEACLGNGREPPTPGGAGGLVEVLHKGEVVRRDYFVSEPDTTNNRMALRSAIEALTLLSARGRRLNIEFVSDSNYLIQGMNEWLEQWRRRGWRRKTGAIENLELWQRLDELAGNHNVRWRWVRGHAGDPRNEYANFLATRAAKLQHNSEGLVESGYLAWRDEQEYK
ncbi:MAG TPA: ribonuclease H [Gemmatimonadales bacterium]|nr:ribonuclease H [Gemmatimonadales bacterium]